MEALEFSDVQTMSHFKVLLKTHMVPRLLNELKKDVCAGGGECTTNKSKEKRVICFAFRVKLE